VFFQLHSLCSSHVLSSLSVATLSRFHKTFKDTFKCFLSYDSDFKREWIIGFLNNSLYLKAYTMLFSDYIRLIFIYVLSILVGESHKNISRSYFMY